MPYSFLCIATDLQIKIGGSTTKIHSQSCRLIIRIILDTDGDFTWSDGVPPITFKLYELGSVTRDVQGVLQGDLIVRPVPKRADVTHAKSVMGRGQNGVWTGTLFEAADTPESMFPIHTVNTTGTRVLERFCIRFRFAPQVSGLKTMLIYTDGACAFALEKKGPDGKPHVHTSNRAELRSAIEALNYRDWWAEGWQRIIIATDSEYVGKGATEWLRNWAVGGWRTFGNKSVANQDLWRALSEALGLYAP